MHKEFSKQLEIILDTARNAPSSHNTQPWLVRVASSHIEVGYDPLRQLNVGDPNKNELFISLGCFIESIRIAALDFKFVTRTKYISDKPTCVVEIYFDKTQKIHLDKLSSSLIRKRRSDRRFYDKKDISGEIVEELNKLNSNNVKLSIFNDAEDIDFLADETYKATLETMSEQSFRNELATWVRHNWTNKLDGMPAYTQGMPGLISLVAKPMIRKNKKVALSQAKKDSKRVRKSAIVGIISAKDLSASNLLNVGAIYQDFCLLNLNYDIKTSGISAAVINSKTSKRIEDKLELDSRPLALIRAGYRSGNVKSSPRLGLNVIMP
jgi:hypothetical protein